jgi:hypothetical protein
MAEGRVDQQKAFGRARRSGHEQTPVGDYDQAKRVAPSTHAPGQADSIAQDRLVRCEEEAKLAQHFGHLPPPSPQEQGHDQREAEYWDQQRVPEDHHVKGEEKERCDHQPRRLVGALGVDLHDQRGRSPHRPKRKREQPGQPRQAERDNDPGIRARLADDAAHRDYGQDDERGERDGRLPEVRGEPARVVPDAHVA